MIFSASFNSVYRQSRQAVIVSAIDNMGNGYTWRDSRAICLGFGRRIPGSIILLNSCRFSWFPSKFTFDDEAAAAAALSRSS